ncbi:MAG: carbamoyltransferase HypF, partial [Phycisphaerae bacterium]
SSDDYGLMLPYAPLHHLLFAEGLPPLVMTSANPSDEPLCRDNDEALRRLAGIADAFLLHDRDIERRVDDSVVMVCTSGRAASAGGRVESEDRGHLLPPGLQRDVPLVLARSHEGTAVDGVLPIRRARGFAPAPIEVAIEAPEPILALGGELKSTICLLAGRQAVLSEHLGELSNPATYRNFVQTITCFQDLLRLEPRVLACDLHPDYVATRHARRQGLPVVEVQHHHAHVASCLADNGLSGRVLGVACDGTGYGTDGAIWGCEILDCDEAGFTRAAHLAYFPLPGGDSAAQDTWRPAVALLHQAFGSDWRRAAGFWARRIEPRALAVTAERLAGPARFPMTSSLGRLFDAVAFLLGVCDRNRYEAEAAMTLEALARRCPPEQALPYVLRDDGGPLRLDVAPMLRALVERIRAGDRADRLARAFHDTLSDLLAQAVLRAAERTGLNRVVLSGGCFVNRLLLEGIAEPLRRAGLAVFAHRRVPTGDGGLALGQAVVAAARLTRS